MALTPSPDPWVVWSGQWSQIDAARPSIGRFEVTVSGLINAHALLTSFFHDIAHPIDGEFQMTLDSIDS